MVKVSGVIDFHGVVAKEASVCRSCLQRLDMPSSLSFQIGLSWPSRVRLGRCFGIQIFVLVLVGFFFLQFVLQEFKWLTVGLDEFCRSASRSRFGLPKFNLIFNASHIVEVSRGACRRCEHRLDMLYS